MTVLFTGLHSALTVRALHRQALTERSSYGMCSQAKTLPLSSDILIESEPSAYSADGQIIASASYDGTIKLWNARSFQEIASFIGHEATVADVAFSPNSSIIASASDDKAIKLWDINTGQEVATLKGHTGEVARVVFSPDGSRIVSASVDASIRFWDAKTGEQVAIFSGHSGGVGSIAFSPERKTSCIGKQRCY